MTREEFADSLTDNQRDFLSEWLKELREKLGIKKEKNKRRKNV